MKYGHKNFHNMLSQITAILIPMHEANYVHRDIKSDNIFIYIDVSKTRWYRLGDFNTFKNLNEVICTLLVSKKTNLIRCPHELFRENKNQVYDLYQISILYEFSIKITLYKEMHQSWRIEQSLIG